MVGIAPPSGFEIFIRKIGYSVGLENTYERVYQLVQLYAEERSVSPTAWKNLIHQKWGLKNEHITDFFISIGIFIRQQSNVLPGELLDSMAVSYLCLELEEERQKAIDFILTHALIQQDGDIFLNCISAEFDNSKIINNLTDCIKHKRKVLLKSYKNAEIINKIKHAVNIDYQPSNKGSAGAENKTLEARLAAEIGSQRGPSMDEISDNEIRISKDYLRKAPGRRKAWAVSIGVCDQKGKLTDAGRSFLSVYSKEGVEVSKGVFCFWPTDNEFVSLRIRPEQLDIVAQTSWEKLCVAYQALTKGTVIEEYDADFHDKIIEQLFFVYEKYKYLSPSRSMLRNQLPINTAYKAILSISYARGKNIPPLPEVVEKERSGDTRRIDLRRSRAVEGALIFREQKAK